MNKRKIKLYTHHFTYTSTDALGVPTTSFWWRIYTICTLPVVLVFRLCYLSGLFIVRVVRFTLEAVFRISYLFGLALVYPFVLASKSKRIGSTIIEREIAKTISSIEAKWKRVQAPEFALRLGVFGLLCLVSVSIFSIAHFYARGQDLKGRVLSETSVALTELERGKELLAAENPAKATEAFSLALKQFNETRSTIGNAGSILGAFMSLVPAKRDADHVLAAGSLLAGSAISLTRIYDLSEELEFSEAGVVAKRPLPEILTELSAELQSSLSNVTLARDHLENTDVDSLPLERREQFVTLRTQLLGVEKGLSALSGVVDLGQKIMLGKKHVLLLFQNSNELRPSGGFIGTFGRLDLEDGRVNNLHVSSIYDLDGQLTERIKPPYPLLQVNDRWFMRDSNWFADFPTSAEVITGFYEKEGGRTPDIILAMTPDIIVDLLAITGPVTLPQYDVTLTSDNFVELTQIETSIEYDRAENKPKQMLADFVPVFLGRLSSLEPEQSLELIQVLQNNFVSRNILVYARNQELQAELSKFGWTGSIAEANRDYVYIVKTNLNGSKTDLYIQDSVELQSAIAKDGSITNTLRLTRKNTLPDLPAMTNTSFLRIFVPKGSILKEAQGFSHIDLDAVHENFGEVHSAVFEWEKNAVKDITTGTILGTESGKTFFGNWVTLSGGETKTIELTYVLPFTLEPLDRLSLVTQKQPGTKFTSFTYSLLFPGRTLHWKNSRSDSLEVGKYSVSIPTMKDYFVGAVLEQY